MERGITPGLFSRKKRSLLYDDSQHCATFCLSGSSYAVRVGQIDGDGSGISGQKRPAGELCQELDGGCALRKPYDYELTALVILVPEAVAAVERFRQEYDWSAQRGLGPHITVLLPFVEAGPSDVKLLKDLFGACAPFAFQLLGPERFDRYVYLEPHPREPFIELTNRVLCAYPDLQPYDGQFAYEGVIPHLTVAYHEDESVLDRVYCELAGSRVEAVASSVLLMECREECWHRVCEFRLAG